MSSFDPSTNTDKLSDVFLWLLHNNGFKKESMTHIRLDAISTATPLTSRATVAMLPRFSALGVSHDATLRCRRLSHTAAVCGTTARASETSVRR